MHKTGGEWALFSVPFEVRNPGDWLKLHYINHLLTKGEMRIDRVLVRKESRNVVIEDEGVLLLNNLRVRRVHPFP